MRFRKLAAMALIALLTAHAHATVTYVWSTDKPESKGPVTFTFTTDAPLTYAPLFYSPHVTACYAGAHAICIQPVVFISTAGPFGPSKAQIGLNWLDFDNNPGFLTSFVYGFFEPVSLTRDGTYQDTTGKAVQLVVSGTGVSSAVPEPGTWIAMAGGLFAVGSVIRRRKATKRLSQRALL